MGREIRATKPKIIATFDFDGTITTRDTLAAFILHAVGIGRLVKASIQSLPFLLLYKLKFIPNNIAKERLFKYFFSGMSMNAFTKLSFEFSDKIDSILNTAAMEKLTWHQRMGHEVVIISASPENWISPWANKNGITTVLSTRLETVDGRITGTFLSKNCHGEEKVSRLLDRFPERGSYELYAYGDSSGDKELLALADHAFFKCF